MPGPAPYSVSHAPPSGAAAMPHGGTGTSAVATESALTLPTMLSLRVQ